MILCSTNFSIFMLLLISNFKHKTSDQNVVNCMHQLRCFYESLFSVKYLVTWTKMIRTNLCLWITLLIYFYFLIRNNINLNWTLIIINRPINLGQYGPFLFWSYVDLTIAQYILKMYTWLVYTTHVYMFEALQMINLLSFLK